jgi:hypothetical protein
VDVPVIAPAARIPKVPDVPRAGAVWDTATADTIKASVSIVPRTRIHLLKTAVGYFVRVFINTSIS